MDDIKLENLKIEEIERDNEFTEKLFSKFRDVEIGIAKDTNNSQFMVSIINKDGIDPKCYTKDSEFAEYITLMHQVTTDNNFQNVIKLASSCAALCCLFNNLFESFKRNDPPNEFTEDLLKAIGQEVSDAMPLITGKLKELYDEFNSDIDKIKYINIMNDKIKTDLKNITGQKEH